MNYRAPSESLCQRLALFAESLMSLESTIDVDMLRLKMTQARDFTSSET